MLARWWVRPTVYLCALAVVFWLVQGIGASIAQDATLTERDAQEQRRVEAALAQAERTRAIEDAYADSLAAARAAVRTQLVTVAAEIPTLSLPMQRLVASCQALEVRSGDYVVSVLQANTAADTLYHALTLQVAALEGEAHPRWYRRAARAVVRTVRDAPVPLVAGFIAGLLIHRHPP